MAKKLNSVLGVDIGSQKIKVAELRSQGREPVVSALGIVDTPEGAVDHTGVYNSEAVGQALKQAIQQCGASISHAVVSIAGQASVLVRTLEVPRMNATELREHMQWEINRNIPFAESNVVSDYKPLQDDDPNSQNMDVVMAIAPQSAIDTMIDCVKRAGKVPVAIDVEPLAIARSLMRSYDDIFSAQTVCLVDMGHKTTSINIYRDGKLLMPRQIPVGGEMFTNQIRDALQIPFEEAETLKLEKGEIPETASLDTFGPSPFEPPSPTTTPAAPTQEFQPYNPFADDPVPAGATQAMEPAAANPFAVEQNPFDVATTSTEVAEPATFNPFEDTPPPSAPSAAPVVAGDPESARIYQAMAPVLDEFLAEIRRSVDYFRSRGGDIQRIVLCGGGTKLRGLSPFISRNLGLECDLYDPLRRLNINPKKVAIGFAEEHKQEFAIAIGNGLHIFFD